MRFFKTFYNSLFNFSWLRAQKDNYRFAWGYFILLSFLLSGLLSVLLLSSFWLVVPKIQTKIINETPDFTATIKNGQLSVEKLIQPYVWNFDGGAAVINTVATTTDSAKNYINSNIKTAILFTKDKVQTYSSDSDTFSEQSFGTISVMSFNRDLVVQAAQKYMSKQALTYFSFGFVVIAFLFIVAGGLFSALVFSLLFLLITRRKKLDWNFKQIFTVALFVITLPKILSIFAGGLGVWSSLVFNGMMFVWMWFVIVRDEVKKEMVK